MQQYNAAQYNAQQYNSELGASLTLYLRCPSEYNSFLYNGGMYNCNNFPTDHVAISDAAVEIMVGVSLVDVISSDDEIFLQFPASIQTDTVRISDWLTIKLRPPVDEWGDQ